MLIVSNLANKEENNIISTSVYTICWLVGIYLNGKMYLYQRLQWGTGPLGEVQTNMNMVILIQLMNLGMLAAMNQFLMTGTWGMSARPHLPTLQKHCIYKDNLRKSNEMRKFIQSKLNEISNIDSGSFIPDGLVEIGKLILAINYKMITSQVILTKMM